MAEYLNRTGSVIVILTLIFLAIIMSTQFSFGRFFAAVIDGGREAAAAASRSSEWREERRREKQRREVIAKHTKKGAARGDQSRDRGGRLTAALPRAPKKRAIARPRPTRCAPRPASAPVQPPPPPRRPGSRCPRAAAARPGVDGEALSGGAQGDHAFPPLALFDAPKRERKIDERELMDGARLLEEKCREFSVEGTVVQIHPGPVVTTFEFKPDAGVSYSRRSRASPGGPLPAMRAESLLIDRISASPPSASH